MNKHGGGASCIPTGEQDPCWQSPTAWWATGSRDMWWPKCLRPPAKSGAKYWTVFMGKGKTFLDVPGKSPLCLTGQGYVTWQLPRGEGGPSLLTFLQTQLGHLAADISPLLHRACGRGAQPGPPTSVRAQTFTMFVTLATFPFFSGLYLLQDKTRPWGDLGSLPSLILNMTFM